MLPLNLVENTNQAMILKSEIKIIKPYSALTVGSPRDICLPRAHPFVEQSSLMELDQLQGDPESVPIYESELVATPNSCYTILYVK